MLTIDTITLAVLVIVGTQTYFVAKDNGASQVLAFIVGIVSAFIVWFLTH